MSAFKSKTYVSILGEPILKWKVHLSLAVVLLVVCAAIGTAYYIMLQNRGAVVSVPEVATSETEVVTPEPLPEVVERLEPVLPDRYDTLSPLAQILEKHLRATQLDEVRDFIAQGSFGGELSNHKIVLKARAPNLYKFKTEYAAPGMVVEFGYDSEFAWIKDSRLVMGKSNPETDTFVSIAIMEASFAHLAWSYGSLAAQEYGLNTVLEWCPSEIWHGRECDVVRSYGLLPITMYHYIDKATSREVYRRAKFANAADEMVEVGIEYSPPDESAAYALPMGYRIFIDGKLHDTVEYTEVRFNRVIMSGIFTPPPDSFSTSVGRP